MPSSELIIADSSPLIGLARIGHLWLMPRLAKRIVVPQAVWREVTMAQANAPDAREVARQPWIEIQAADPNVNRAVVSETSRGLGIYKVLMVEALAWARGQKAAHVVGTIELTFPIREFLKETGCAAGSGSKSLRACWPPRFGRAGKAIQPRSWSLLRALRAAMSRS